MEGQLGGSIVFGGQDHWHVLLSHIPYTPYPLLSNAGATSRKCGCTTSFESSGMTDSSSVLPLSLPLAHDYPTWQGKAGQDGTGQDRARRCKVDRAKHNGAGRSMAGWGAIVPKSNQPLSTHTSRRVPNPFAVDQAILHTTSHHQ
ncbi:hypothetical protein L208DRAFT_1377256 [Tricholoma matsutake]|nr:hypothetical protein L208DRAFT_1377256 [Tricholoma matsutake 945]